MRIAGGILCIRGGALGKLASYGLLAMLSNSSPLHQDSFTSNVEPNSPPSGVAFSSKCSARWSQISLTPRSW